MRLLLDSQILLWSMYDTSRLPLQTTKVLREQDHTFFVSDASLWEIGIKASKGRLEYVSNPLTFYQHIAPLEFVDYPFRCHTFRTLFSCLTYMATLSTAYSLHRHKLKVLRWCPWMQTSSAMTLI